MAVYNFSAGPATLPRTVMQRIQEEMLDYHGIGASIIELGHRTPAFRAVMSTAVTLFRKVTSLPDDFHVLFVHGGARMQFSAVPLNLLSRSPIKLSCHVETGYFSQRAREEAQRYGETKVIASSADTGFDRIPHVTPGSCPTGAAYAQITSNNTIYGTRWSQFPVDLPVPLVVDATSDLLSRRIDLAAFGLTFAGFQKNLGPSSVALVIVHDDLLGAALPRTPTLLDYGTYARSESLANTPNTFAIYVMSLMMQWVEDQGGLGVVEAVNTEKAAVLYRALDRSSLYTPTAAPDHRSITNVTFRLRDESLTAAFLDESVKRGLLGLQGHFSVGGLRASLYNGMPLAGVEALVEFLDDFDQRSGLTAVKA